MRSALFQDGITLHRRRRRCALTNMIYDVTPVRAVVEADREGESRTGAARHRRQSRDSYQQLWTSVRCNGPQGHRSAALGKSDLDQSCSQRDVQMNPRVKFAGSFPPCSKASRMCRQDIDPKSRDSIAAWCRVEILNKSISSERSFAGVSISLSRAKVLAKQAGGKLNDVVLAISSGVVGAICWSAALCREGDDGRGCDFVARRGQHDANNQVVRHDLFDRHNIEDPRRGWKRSSRNPPSRRKCLTRCGP